MSQAEPTKQLVEKLRKFLRGISVMSLATVDDEGEPHAINAYFAADEDLNLFFVSHPQSAHSLHVRARPQVAVTVFAPVKMWQQVRGVQIHGECLRIEQDEWDQVWSVFLKKFPHMMTIKQHVSDSQFYRIMPNWIRWTDNSVHFGYKVALEWPLPEAITETGRGASIV